MLHPSYVYSAIFHPKRKGSNILIVCTACFDAKVRIFFVNFDYLQRGGNVSNIILPDPPPPTAAHFLNLLEPLTYLIIGS